MDADGSASDIGEIGMLADAAMDGELSDIGGPGMLGSEREVHSDQGALSDLGHPHRVCSYAHPPIVNADTRYLYKTGKT